VVADQQGWAFRHPVHIANFGIEVAGERFHFWHEPAHELGIELLRGLLELGFRRVRPLAPQTALHEAAKELNYTRWQPLLRSVLFLDHRLAPK
jgi:hypothetical protein